MGREERFLPSNPSGWRGGPVCVFVCARCVSLTAIARVPCTVLTQLYLPAAVAVTASYSSPRV